MKTVAKWTTIHVSGGNFSLFDHYTTRAAAEIALDNIRANGLRAFIIED